VVRRRDLVGGDATQQLCQISRDEGLTEGTSAGECKKEALIGSRENHRREDDERTIEEKMTPNPIHMQ
jgi:hypothetical protein